MGISAADFSYIRKLVYDNSAIVLEPGKEYLVETRLNTLLLREGLDSIKTLMDMLRSSGYGSLHQAVIEVITTNETSFFRDIHPFEAMRLHVLPELRQKYANTRRLNIWSAACSSGQEPYSLAILIWEHFPDLSAWNVGITASDISEEMLDIARKGCYSQLDINRGLPAALLVKYFRKDGFAWQIREDLRKAIRFTQINLSGLWPAIPKMDVIFLRNVLIYFDQDTKKGILEKVQRQLKPGGYLFLGSAETTLGLNNAFERKMFGKSVCYRLAA